MQEPLISSSDVVVLGNLRWPYACHAHSLKSQEIPVVEKNLLHPLFFRNPDYVMTDILMWHLSDMSKAYATNPESWCMSWRGGTDRKRGGIRGLCLDHLRGSNALSLLSWDELSVQRLLPSASSSWFSSYSVPCNQILLLQMHQVASKTLFQTFYDPHLPVASSGLGNP